MNHQLGFKIKLIERYTFDQANQPPPTPVNQVESIIRSARSKPARLSQTRQSSKLGSNVQQLTQSLKQIRRQQQTTRCKGQSFDKMLSRDYCQRLVAKQQVHENTFAVDMNAYFNSFQRKQSCLVAMEKQTKRNWKQLEVRTANDNSVIQVNDQGPMKFKVGHGQLHTFPLSPNLTSPIQRRVTKVPDLAADPAPRFGKVVCEHRKRLQQEKAVEDMLKQFLNPEGEPLGKVSQFENLGHVPKPDSTKFDKQSGREGVGFKGTTYEHLPFHFKVCSSSANLRNAKSLKDLNFANNEAHTDTKSTFRKYSVSQLSKMRQQLKSQENPRFSYDQAIEALDYKTRPREKQTFIRQAIAEGLIDIGSLVRKTYDKPWLVQTEKREKD